MRSKRRNGFDITRDILQVCVDGANKTHIVYAANLNSKRINRYLKFCVDTKLLTEQFNGAHFDYHTTPEGVHFLRTYFGASQGENVAQIR
ncbi:MAG: winged helix-turn-helix domain-containing protein [Candidatus Bathyarchaeia archaeon]